VPVDDPGASSERSLNDVVLELVRSPGGGRCLVCGATTRAITGGIRCDCCGSELVMSAEAVLRCAA
jgi:predicted amidophosphoribosyltransferase